MSQFHQIFIVGSGFSGLCAAIKLKEAGIEDYLILEKEAEIGGTWRDNHYPGSECDVPSVLYSYSFAPNPYWSRTFPRQSELKTYTEQVAKRFDLMGRIRLNSEVVEARFDGKDGWLLRLKSGIEYRCQFLFIAAGFLNRPSIPSLPGLVSFAGTYFHSARWRHDVDLNQKNVAIIGTGASAIQIIPEIAPKTKNLFVFQKRTPSWVMPKRDKRISPLMQKVFAGAPWIQKAFRLMEFLRYERGATLLTYGGRVIEKGEVKLKKHISDSVKDKSKVELLTPNYRLGCKRILLSNSFYSAIDLPHVSLVPQKVRSIEGSTLLTEDGQRMDVDVIVFATGFFGTPDGPPFPIYGKDGTDLKQTWKESDFEAYLGIFTYGFPNLAYLLGPNSQAGSSSIVYMIENQVQYVVEALKYLRKKSFRYLMVNKDVQRLYREKIRRSFSKSVWLKGNCHSRYQSTSGENVSTHPGPAFGFFLKSRKFLPDCFEIK